MVHKRFFLTAALLAGLLTGVGAIAGCGSREKAPIVICLDPGHDETHPGAAYFGAREEELTLKIAEACKEELEANGVTVVMTRSSMSCALDDPQSGMDGLRECLGNRVAFAKAENADYLVSLHLNAVEDHSLSGAAVFVPNKNYGKNVTRKAEKMAENILEQLVSLGLQSRGVASRDTTDGYANPDGTTADYYKLIREGKWEGIPTMIVEHCFLDSEEDYREFLSSDESLAALGRADARGILEAIR